MINTVSQVGAALCLSPCADVSFLEKPSLQRMSTKQEAGSFQSNGHCMYGSQTVWWRHWGGRRGYARSQRWGNLLNIMHYPYFMPQPVRSCMFEALLPSGWHLPQDQDALWFYGCCTTLPHSQAYLPLLPMGQGQHEETVGLRPQTLCTLCSTSCVCMQTKAIRVSLRCMFPGAVDCVTLCNKL